MSVIKHSIRNPSGIRTIISMSMIALGSIPNLIIVLTEKANLIRISAAVTVSLVCVLIAILALFRALKKPTEIHLYSGEILLNGRTIQAKEIKAIKHMGYFRPVIGLLPNGKKIVPVHMCFRFSQNEDRGIADIVNWAEANHVKVVNKSFMRWI
ncbi:hypothetical protein [Cohnella lupini]|uniref:hypothetical protein n=1 Tax=Cohnella lupini TaxID=1294267 RepID=UPI000E2626C3|nr:hypothetical protein [Cohnella lupini]